jgi:gluconolactonase
MNDKPSALVETGEPQQLANGFQFTEGPLWSPEGFFYFVDIRANRIYRLRPGGEPEVFRENSGGGNGTTFDMTGNLIVCEGGNRRVTRTDAAGNLTIVADNFQGKRLNAPNDVVCRSDGSIYFTDPTFRMPFSEREVESNGVYRVTPDGAITLVAEAELPNGLAFSPDERTLYVANTRATHYVLAFELAVDGMPVRRRIFADMSSDEQGGAPDGMKVDAEGRVYCTGAGGTWVFAPSGELLGVIRLPEIAANLAFGGPDLKTLFFTARTSVYAVQMKVAGQPHPWY